MAISQNNNSTQKSFTDFYFNIFSKKQDFSLITIINSRSAYQQEKTKMF